MKFATTKLCGIWNWNQKVFPFFASQTFRCMWERVRDRKRKWNDFLHCGFSSARRIWNNTSLWKCFFFCSVWIWFQRNFLYYCFLNKYLFILSFEMANDIREFSAKALWAKRRNVREIVSQFKIMDGSMTFRDLKWDSWALWFFFLSSVEA